jgi:sulfopyruvate decarboxylase subunit beta
VGGFPTATATGTDLAACARGAGIENAVTVTNIDDFVSAVRAALAGERLACVVAKVEAVGPPGYIVDTHMLEDRFMFARAMREEPRGGGRMP